jgi:hypothetical protein
MRLTTTASERVLGWIKEKKADLTMPSGLRPNINPKTVAPPTKAFPRAIFFLIATKIKMKTPTIRTIAGR